MSQSPPSTIAVDVHHYLHLTPDSTGAILSVLTTIKAQGEQIMGIVEDLRGEVGIIKTDLVDALTRVTAHEQAEEAANADLKTQVDTLTKANADLQTQVDALKASGVDTTALQAILTDLKGVQTSIESIDAAPAPAPAPPAPTGGETPVP